MLDPHEIDGNDAKQQNVRRCERFAQGVTRSHAEAGSHYSLRDSLRAFADMVPNLISRKDDMREAARRGFSTATDLADYVVHKGIPFRDAHEIVGKAVAYGVQSGKDLSEMTLEELQQFSGEITEDVFDVLTLEGSVAARNHIGGTAPDQVRAAAARAKTALTQR